MITIDTEVDDDWLKPAEGFDYRFNC